MSQDVAYTIFQNSWTMQMSIVMPKFLMLANRKLKIEEQVKFVFSFGQTGAPEIVARYVETIFVIL